MNVDNHVAIIAGSTGTLGPQISEKLKDEGYKVYGGSRSAKTDFQYTKEQLKDTAYWYGKIAELANESSTIVLINTIGQASPPAGSTLEDVNIRPVVALAMAGKQFATDHPEKKVVVVQVSAIAALYLGGNAYGDSRAEADRQVVALGTEDPKENFKTVALQMPFIFVEPKADEADPKKFKIRGLHPWSMEQVAGLPIVPLAGSGEQIVYPVSLGDVTTSIANAVNITDSQAIEVKGGKGMTQKELIDFYAKLRNKNILYVPTPTPILSFVLDHFPHGLLAGYAPRVMANLSEEESRSANEPFDELLGRPAQSMEEAHELLNVEGATVELAAPPIVDHLRAHAGKIMKIGLASLALVGAAYAVHSISTTQ